VDKPALTSAPPPWHTQLIVALLLVYFLIHTPAAIKSMDEIATVETFSKTLFFSLDVVIFWRFAAAILLLSVTTRDFLCGNLDLPTTYYPNSNLKPAIVKFRGLLVVPDGGLWHALHMNTSFSAWSLSLLGFSFFLSGLIPLLAIHFENTTISKGLIRLAVLVWTMSAPSAFLVSLIVKYILWPHNVAQGKCTDGFKKPFILIMHNANSIAALTEVGLMGGLPCRFQDFAVAPMFGLVYILFAWSMSHDWTNDFKRDGPQFIYPFFDTTLGSTCSIAIVALFGCFVLSFCLFSFVEFILTEYVGGGVVGHTIAVVLLSASVCRFRD